MGTVFTHYPGMCGVGSNNHFLFLTRSVHPKLEEYLDAYIKAAGIEDDRRAWLFRLSVPREIEGESNEIQESTCCRSGGAYCVRAVPASNGTEQYTIHNLDDDDTATTALADTEHHHDFSGTGSAVHSDN